MSCCGCKGKEKLVTSKGAVPNQSHRMQKGIENELVYELILNKKKRRPKGATD